LLSVDSLLFVVYPFSRIWSTVSNDHGYVPLVVNTSRSFPHSRLITGFVTRLTRRLPLMKQQLFTLPEHMCSPPVFSGVRVTRSLVFYVCFVDRCLSFCTFSFGHCDVCPSIYGFWLPLWYLQTLLFTEILLKVALGTKKNIKPKRSKYMKPISPIYDLSFILLLIQRSLKILQQCTKGWLHAEAVYRSPDNTRTKPKEEYEKIIGQ
jgi:hypothetical protein